MKALTKKASCDWTEDSYIVTVTPSLIDKFHYPFVQEMGDLQANSTYYTERENLPSFLLVYTLSGCGTLLYENKTYTLRTGDMFLIDCHKFQHYRTDPSDLWHLQFVHFYGGSSPVYYAMFAAESESVLHLRPTSKVPIYLDRILQCYQPANRNSDLLASMYIVQMLTEIVLNAREQALYNHSNSISEIANYIEEHFAERITLDTLARQSSLSKTYMPKKFKAQFGVSPTEYLCRVRMRKAKELLLYTDDQICEIAESTGFDNPSYFIKLFKQHEHLTPMVYRSKWKSGLSGTSKVPWEA